MRGLFIILSIVLCCEAAFSGVHIGLPRAIKERVKKLDERVAEKKAETTVEEANEALSDAIEALQEGDAEGALAAAERANSLYKKALLEDPDNPDAHFGVAFTGVIMVANNEKVKEAMEAWQASEVPLLGFPSPGSVPNLPKSLKTFVDDATNEPPKVSDIQKVIEEEVVGAIDEALQHFKQTEDSTWQQTTFKIQGKKIEIDRTELYLLSGFLYFLRFICTLTVSYNLDVVYEDFETEKRALDAVKKILLKEEPYQNFLTIRSNTALEKAGKSVKGFGEKVLLAMDYFEKEKDPQDDDLIPKSPNFLPEDPHWKDQKETFKKLAKVLDEPIVEEEECELRLWVFFNGGLQDLRYYFVPAFDRDKFKNENVIKWIDLDGDEKVPDFNDPTFNGMLPGMTNEKLRKLLGIQESKLEE